MGSLEDVAAGAQVVDAIADPASAPIASVAIDKDLKETMVHSSISTERFSGSDQQDRDG